MGNKDFKVFVGIDPSITNTGIVALDQEGSLLLIRGVGDTKSLLILKNMSKVHLKTQKSYLVLSEIASTVTSDVLGLASSSEDIIIGYENYSYASDHKAERIGELGGVLKTSLAVNNVALDLVAPTQVKLFATGHGHASKNQMKKAAIAEEPTLANYVPKKADHFFDICDAFFLAKFIWYKYARVHAAKIEGLNCTPLLRHRLEYLRKVSTV